MSKHDVPTHPRQAQGGAPARWTKVRLIEPSTAGFVYVGASTGSWRLPVALPRARRRRTLALMHAAATDLHRDPGVVRADVFEALLRPPGRRRHGPGQDVPDANFDVVLLIETTTVAQATELSGDTTLAGLQDDLRETVPGTLVFVGSNPRRIGPVDHDRQGVFLFNYFSAEDVDSNLYAWQYTAGWFQDETGLDNSTVLQPTDPENIPYRLVNHCRWDHLTDVMPSLVFKRSFPNFVLRTFTENQVAARPILYKLHRVH